MSHFLPTRASPPPKPSPAYSSELAHAYPPELAHLTQEEIRLIDAVIDRAGREATTFLTVFKAYNDVLTAEGLDPREVVYYGKLLKLGTLKGRNWGEKWRMVKSYNGYEANPPRPTQATDHHRALSEHNDIPSKQPYIPKEDADSQKSKAEVDKGVPAKLCARAHALPHHLRPPSPSENSTDIGSFAILSAPHRFRNYHDSQSENTEEHVPSTTPPSYSAAVRFPVPTTTPNKTDSVRRLLALAAAISEPKPAATSPRTKARQERHTQKPSNNNDDDAWKKIQWKRDEEDADKFWEESLLLRCWNVWRQGYEWIRSTHQQVEDARQNLELRVAFRRWLVLYYSRQENTLGMVRQADARFLKLFFIIWRQKWKERRQGAWRRQMRNNMKVVRERHDLNLQKVVFVRWSNAYHIAHLEKDFRARWLSKYLNRWKAKHLEVVGLDHTAKQALVLNEKRSARRYFNVWQRMLLLKDMERHMVEAVRIRRLAFFMTVWQKRLERFTAAARYYEVSLQRRVLRKWEDAHNRVQAMEIRVQRYLVRQDAVLMRAVMRVWIAHERGKQFEQTRSAKLRQRALRVWNQHLQFHRQVELKAVAFSERPSSSTAVLAFATWLNATRSHHSALSEAMQHHQTLLLSVCLTRWQVLLKYNQEKVHTADLLALRQLWRAWRLRLGDKQRQRKLRQYQKNRLHKFFRLWYLRTQDSRRLRLCEQDIRMRMNQRIISTALRRWESRVTEIKAREDLVTRHSERNVQRRAFAHWTTICLKHVKRLDLLESQLIVKQKEFVNGAFCRWFAAAHAATEMRRLLAEQQEEARLSALKGAWDKWRERFIAERLMPKEIEVRELMQRNLAFRMFGIWHSRTRSLPAVHLYAKNTKARYFQVWLEAVPQAQRARKQYGKVMFSKYLKIWLQKYRQKMAARAVNRARYLRLSTNTPRNSTGIRYPVNRPLPPQEDVSATTGDEESGSEDGGTEVHTLPVLLATKNRQERTVEKAREGLKARGPDGGGSDKGEVAGRGKFWQELEQIRSKSRPPSEAASTSTRRL